MSKAGAFEAARAAEIERRNETIPIFRRVPGADSGRVMPGGKRGPTSVGHLLVLRSGDRKNQMCRGAYHKTNVSKQRNTPLMR
jgi:hypothetical protein